MSPESLRQWAAALIAANLALGLFSLTGTAVLRTGLPAPAFDYERLASGVAQTNIVLGTGAALALMAASQGFRRALFLLLLAAVLGGGSEWLSLETGLPFGRYSYTALLGPALWGGLPILIPLAWFGVCASALLLAHRLASRSGPTVGFAALLVTLYDLVLDPAMTTGFVAWHWQDTGPYYGIPFTNFVAWFAVSAMIVALYGLAYRDWRPDASPHALGLYLAQGLLPAGLSLVYGRGGAAAVWALGVAALCVGLRHMQRRGGTP